MNDHEGNRQAPSETRIKLPHHGRFRGVAKYDSGKHPARSNGHVRPRRKDVISPPPLKRQRTTYEDFDAGTHDPRSISQQAHPSVDSGRLTHSFSGHTETASTAQSKQRSHVMPVSKSFPAPSFPHLHDNPNTSGPRRRHVSHARNPSKPALSQKPTCRICDKSSATSYNPIVQCSGCSKFYHDSCRKPPLAAGIDPLSWRCSSCSSNGGTGTKAKLSSALAPTSHSVVRDIFKPRYVPPAPVVRPSDHHSKKDPDIHVKPESARLTATSTSTSAKLTRPKKVTRPPQPPEPKPLVRTEIPNTPSQRSSQIESSFPEKPVGNLSDAHVSEQHLDVPSDNDILAMEASANVQPHTPLTTLCSTCQKQVVLARPKANNVQCSGCRIRTRVVDTGRLEIPGTPDVDSNHNAPSLLTSSASSGVPRSTPILHIHEPVAVSSAQDLPVSEAKPDSVMIKENHLSAFDPERAQVFPKTENVHDDGLSCISNVDTQATDIVTTSHESFLGQSIPMEVDSHADISEQKTAIKAKQVLQENTIRDNAAAPQLSTQHGHCAPPIEISNHNEPLTTSEPHGSQSVSPSNSDPPKESEPLEPASAHSESIEMGLAKQCSAERTTNSAVPLSSAEEEAPAVLESKGIAGTVGSPSSLILAVAGSQEPEKPLINRDLIRIALVCAKGTPMTASQIVDWLASRFPYLQKDQSAWKKSVRAVLSRFDEFHGVWAPHESRVVYSFASTDLEAENEERYQSYLMPASVRESHRGVQKARKSVRQQRGADALSQHEYAQSGPSIQTKQSVTKTIQSSPSRSDILTHDSFSPPRTARVTPGGDTMFSPFERTTAPRPKIPFSGVETQRETSLRNVYPRTTASSIETMTSEQKAAKIAEIKTRPKRKQFFGAVHHLAHVRRYDRRDIHDESDKARKSDSTAQRSMLEHDSAINDCDENQSLLEIFNLPKNAIPMNDGKELAFRDGTLVNGRLPRSRRIYRVGKVFGRELTIS